MRFRSIIHLKKPNSTSITCTMTIIYKIIYTQRRKPFVCEVLTTINKDGNFVHWFAAKEIIKFLNFAPSSSLRKILHKYVRRELKREYWSIRNSAVNCTSWNYENSVGNFWHRDKIFISTIAVELLCLQPIRDNSIFGEIIDSDKNMRFLTWLRNTLLPSISFDLAASDTSNSGPSTSTKVETQNPLPNNKNTVKAECVICYDARSEYIAIPCGHLLYCRKCRHNNVVHCPICKVQITNLQMIYFP